MSADRHRLKQQLAERGITLEEWREAIYPDFTKDEPQIPEKKADTVEYDANMDIGRFSI